MINVGDDGEVSYPGGWDLRESAQKVSCSALISAGCLESQTESKIARAPHSRACEHLPWLSQDCEAPTRLCQSNVGTPPDLMHRLIFTKRDPFCFRGCNRLCYSVPSSRVSPRVGPATATEALTPGRPPGADAEVCAGVIRQQGDRFQGAGSQVRHRPHQQLAL